MSPFSVVEVAADTRVDVAPGSLPPSAQASMAPCGTRANSLTTATAHSPDARSPAVAKAGSQARAATRSGLIFIRSPLCSPDQERQLWGVRRVLTRGTALALTRHDRKWTAATDQSPPCTPRRTPLSSLHTVRRSTLLTTCSTRMLTCDAHLLTWRDALPGVPGRCVQTWLGAGVSHDQRHTSSERAALA